MHRHPSRVCVAFVMTRKKKKKSRLLFIFLSRCLRKKVINTGNDYNVCELRLVEMSIQSTVQGLSSQSSCFDLIDRPNVFSMEVVTFCCRLYVLFLSIVWICGFNQVPPLISRVARGSIQCGKATRATRKKEVPSHCTKLPALWSMTKVLKVSAESGAPLPRQLPS